MTDKPNRSANSSLPVGAGSSHDGASSDDPRSGTSKESIENADLREQINRNSSNSVQIIGMSSGKPLAGMSIQE